MMLIKILGVRSLPIDGKMKKSLPGGKLKLLDIGGAGEGRTLAPVSRPNGLAMSAVLKLKSAFKHCPLGCLAICHLSGFCRYYSFRGCFFVVLPPRLPPLWGVDSSYFFCDICIVNR